MSKNNVIRPEGRETIEDPVTELLRVGAQQLIQRAVEAELAELLSRHNDRRTETGHAGVVRNGYLPERELQTLGGHFKTGQRGSPQKRPMEMARDGDVLPFRTSTVQARFGTPASGTALENVTVMEKAVQHRGDSGAVA